MDHGVKAAELFVNGYNCAQSVAVAFCDVTGLEEKTVQKEGTRTKQRPKQKWPIVVVAAVLIFAAAGFWAAQKNARAVLTIKKKPTSKIVKMNKKGKGRLQKASLFR